MERVGSTAEPGTRRGLDRDPACGQFRDQLENFDEKEIDRLQAIIQSMTPAERANPKLIDGSRRARIAKGSGRQVSDVNQLVDRFFEARKMMAQMSGRMGMGAMNRKSNRKGKKGKGKKGKGRGRGPTPPKMKGGFPPMGGMPGMPGGFPDLSNMPPGLDQLPPGLEGIDISQFQQPKKKK